VIQIGRDITGDCSIMSRDVPRGPELYLERHGYDTIVATHIPPFACELAQQKI